MNVLWFKLEKELKKRVEEFSGIIGFGLKDILTGEEIFINGDELFPIASSVKIPILIEFFRKAEEGEIDIERSLTFREDQRVGGSGVLKEIEAGTLTINLLGYATLMITVSDNSATNIILNLVGMKDVNNTLERLGLSKTVLVRKMMDKEGLAAGRENLSTPREMLKMMEKLYKKEDLSPWVCEKTLEMLKKHKEGIIEGVIRNAVPDNVEIADKSGWVEGAMCDVGIVFLDKRPYLIALMAKHIPLSDSRRLATIRILTEMAELAFNYFYEVSISTPYGRR
ncbi:serine hydrolase [Candidatus Bathyarchaeota archaeon]|nr:serine hydrolase [Candidatus Bathyarchaeota archaeon]MBS7631211.1 serine hydrolase [Candidatus Bathyarchaeota archaeon]